MWETSSTAPAPRPATEARPVTAEHLSPSWLASERMAGNGHRVIWPLPEGQESPETLSAEAPGGPRPATAEQKPGPALSQKPNKDRGSRQILAQSRISLNVNVTQKLCSILECGTYSGSAYREKHEQPPRCLLLSIRKPEIKRWIRDRSWRR